MTQLTLVHIAEGSRFEVDGKIYTLIKCSDGGYNWRNEEGRNALCQNTYFCSDSITSGMLASMYRNLPHRIEVVIQIPPKRLVTPITRMHHTDLECAAMNGGEDTQAIWERLKETHDFVIHEVPLDGVYYHDFSISFMYPQGAKAAFEKEKHDG